MTDSTPPPRARVTMWGNTKGGSGKTTNAVNFVCFLGSGVAGLPPQRVLLVDLEPLATASKWLCGDAAERADNSSAALFEPAAADEPPEDRLVRLRGLVHRALHEPVDVILAHGDGLKAADRIFGQQFALKDNLALLAGEYDHIVLDLPASRTERLLYSALIASDGILCPVQPVMASIESSAEFFRAVEEVRRGANQSLVMDGLVLSDAGHKNDVDAAHVRDALRRALPRYPVFRTQIRTLKAVMRASTFRVSVLQMENSTDAVADYYSLVLEWAMRIGLVADPRLPSPVPGASS